MSDSIELLQQTLIRTTKRALDEGKINAEQHEDILLMPIRDLDELELAYLNLQYHTLLNRLVKGAEYLEQNLAPKTRESALKKYNHLTDEFLKVKEQYYALRRGTA